MLSSVSRVINMRGGVVLESLRPKHSVARQKTDDGRKTVMLCDGAPCCKKLSKRFCLVLRQCIHSRIFTVEKQVGRRGLSVHAGGIE